MKYQLIIIKLQAVTELCWGVASGMPGFDYHILAAFTSRGDALEYAKFLASKSTTHVLQDKTSDVGGSVGPV